MSRPCKSGYVCCPVVVYVLLVSRYVFVQVHSFVHKRFVCSLFFLQLYHIFRRTRHMQNLESHTVPLPFQEFQRQSGMNNSANNTLIERIGVDSHSRGSVSSHGSQKLPIMAPLLRINVLDSGHVHVYPRPLLFLEELPDSVNDDFRLRCQPHTLPWPICHLLQLLWLLGSLSPVFAFAHS